MHVSKSSATQCGAVCTVVVCTVFFDKSAPIVRSRGYHTQRGKRGRTSSSTTASTRASPLSFHVGSFGSRTLFGTRTTEHVVILPVGEGLLAKERNARIRIRYRIPNVPLSLGLIGNPAELAGLIIDNLTTDRVTIQHSKPTLGYALNAFLLLATCMRYTI